MDIFEEAELYFLISNGSENINSREETLVVRAKAFNPKIIKVAFDSRRTNQETDINPRRNLQNYNRSEKFITEAVSKKIKNLNLLKEVLMELKEKFEKEPEWQDSNARVLLSSLEKGLRTKIDDGDFSETQQSVGGLNYLEELLHVRYRLVLNELEKLNHKELMDIILSKDEELTNNNLNDNINISKKDIGNMSYDQLLSALFAGVKATKDNPKVSRKITIEIQDSID